MRLTISEIAKLAGVSVRTLHYYDEIDLLKPSETDADTGYRYQHLWSGYSRYYFIGSLILN
jgi:hypothetical protein